MMCEVLPVAIEGVTDRCKDEDDYILADNETGRVVAFYEGYGFKDIEVVRVTPSLGPKRDEIRARLPEGWSTEWRGYWGDYLGPDGVKKFSVFWKGAPWDYCTFVRR